MRTPFGSLTLVDAHVHFLSHRFFQLLLEPVRDRFEQQDPYADVSRRFGIELPGRDPATLAARWVAEMDDHGVDHMVIMATAPGDEESVAAAVRAFPDRLLGTFMLDPTQPEAVHRARRGLRELRLHGVALFPALHQFSVADRDLWPIYQVASDARALVFAHFGLLRIGIRDKLGIPTRIDMRYSNPLDLQPVAQAFPTLSFQVPHFGCGFFREVLMLGSMCPNVLLDTSSSNSWVRTSPEPLALRDVFARSLAVYGPERLLFGTDSTAFPRGWRRDIYEAQVGTLLELEVSKEEAAAVLGGNFLRLAEAHARSRP